MRYILAILAVSFLFGLIFWHNVSLDSRSGFSPFGQGRVLGVSEAAAGPNLNPAGEQLFLLPSSRETGFPLAAKEKPVGPKMKQGAEKIEIAAASGIVLDRISGKVLFAKNIDQPRSIASITKLLTALTFLDYNPDWEKVYKVKRKDIVYGGRIYLQVGDEVKLKDLFYLSLIASANTAAKALSSAMEENENKFVAAMNHKAQELGLSQTKVVEPTGIYAANISTAREVAFLVAKALEVEEIKQALNYSSYSFKTITGRKITVHNTDIFLTRLSGQDLAVLGGKTGFTKAAGYCFTAGFKAHGRPELIAAVLGAPTLYRRFSEAKKIVSWVYDSYKW
jgi:D-alanyl-D-alanine carboxypeptidase